MHFLRLASKESTAALPHCPFGAAAAAEMVNAPLPSLCAYRIRARTKGTRTFGPKRKRAIASPSCSSSGLKRRVRRSA